MKKVELAAHKGKVAKKERPTVSPSPNLNTLRVDQEWSNEEFAADVADANKDTIREMGKKAVAEYRAGKTRPFPKKG